MNIAIFKRRRFVYIQIALIVAAITAAVVAFRLAPLERLEVFVLAKYYEIRGPRTPSSMIAIASIDDSSLRKIGPWPWPRKVFSDLVTNLRQMGAATIVIDTTFAANAFGDDKVLLNQIEEKRDTVIGFSFYPSSEDIPLDQREWSTGEASFDVLTTQMLAATGIPETELMSMAGIKSVPSSSRLVTGSMGFTNIGRPRGDLLFEAPMLARYRNVLLPSLGLAAAARFENFTPLLRKDRDGDLSAVTLGTRNIPLEPSGMMVLNVTGPAGSYQRISVYDLISGAVSREAIDGKIVLVGPVLKGPGTEVATPLGSNVPAIEIWANALDNMLFGRPLVSIAASNFITVAIVFIISLLLGFVLPSVRIWLSVVISVLTAAFVLLDGYLFFSRMDIWFAVVAPIVSIAATLLAVTGYRLATEERKVMAARVHFTGVLADRVIREMADGRSLLPYGGDRRQLTALVVGIRNFSALCDELPHEKLAQFMRGYLKEVVDALSREDAYVQHLGNDRVLAIFGAPAPRADHALRACRASLAIRQSFTKKKTRWKEEYNLASLRISIGIFTGPMVIADVGILRAHGFAAFGNALNICDTLSRLNGTYRTSVIMSPETMQSVREMFTFRALDFIRMKKTHAPLEIYELMGQKGIVTPYIENYTRAYDAYRARNFEKAIAAADEVLKHLPHDGPSQLIRDRSQHFRSNPPAKGWDGTWLVS